MPNDTVTVCAVATGTWFKEVTSDAVLFANVALCSYWLDTTAEFVSDEPADEVFTVMVNGKLAPALMSAVRVQVTVGGDDPLHVNPLALLDDAKVMPEGKVSVTVVGPTASAVAESATVNV
ncbi:MAG TPA: hypothetical protein VGM93_02330 [Acidimicrobiales bacterium]|jgi:hypothetical protein